MEEHLMLWTATVKTTSTECFKKIKMTIMFFAKHKRENIAARTTERAVENLNI